MTELECLRKAVDSLQKKLDKQQDAVHLGKLSVRCMSNCYAYNRTEERCAKCPVVHACILWRKTKEVKDGKST